MGITMIMLWDIFLVVSTCDSTSEKANDCTAYIGQLQLADEILHDRDWHRLRTMVLYSNKCSNIWASDDNRSVVIIDRSIGPESEQRACGVPSDGLLRT